MLHLQSARRSRGFSAIELLVVLAIIALMTLVVAPWFLKISQHNTVKTAAREVSITLAAARMRAVKRNLASQVLITPAAGAQSFHRIETFEMTNPTPIKVGEVDLPTSVSFPSPPSTLQVFFGPDGRATNVNPQTGTPVVIRGIAGNPVYNDVYVWVYANGHIKYSPPPDWK
ncbi:MAG TPA: prepilin-type N-terminal cleavage/methylation domain-containing protein [Thermoanaerobaculia bacterium]